jgi:hypothetical protein
MNTTKNVMSVESFFHEGTQPLNNERFHREAIYNLEKKLVHEPNCVGSLCDWIASYHELSLIYQHKGAVELAQKCLFIPHQSMLYMAKINNDQKELQQIAIKAISLTLPPLIEFTEKYSACDKFMLELKSQLVLIKNKNEHHH